MPAFVLPLLIGSALGIGGGYVLGFRSSQLLTVAVVGGVLYYMVKK